MDWWMCDMIIIYVITIVNMFSSYYYNNKQNVLCIMYIYMYIYIIFYVLYIPIYK